MSNKELIEACHVLHDLVDFNHRRLGQKHVTLMKNLAKWIEEGFIHVPGTPDAYGDGDLSKIRFS